MATKHGLPQPVWDAAKAEIRKVLVACARARGMLAYSDLVQQVAAVRFEAHDVRLFAMLGELSAEEDVAGRGLLSALGGSQGRQYGTWSRGLFELAKTLGRDTSDITKCWVAEVHRVHRAWAP